MTTITPIEAKPAARTLAPGQFNRSQAAFFMACLCGVSGLAAVSLAPNSTLLTTTALLILPLATGLILTGRLTDSLTLVWINEMLFGGSGHWLELGPVSIRWLLLLALIGLGIGQMLLHASAGPVLGRRRPTFTLPTLFYGALLPAWLVSYSVLVKGTSFWIAIGDVNYLLALLAYFAVRQTLGRHFSLVRGWIFGAGTVLAVFFLGLSVAPARIVGPIFVNITGSALGTTQFGINRAATVVQIMLLLGVFAGILYSLDRTLSRQRRLAGALFFLLSVSSYVVMFLRGPLFSIVIVTAVFLLAGFAHRRWRNLAIRMFFALALIGVSAFVLYSLILPEAINRFTVGDSGVAGFVDNARVTQAGQLLAAFAQSPIAGQGAGVPIDGYARSERGLSFELQYLMILYRFGLVGLGLIALAILWYVLQLFRVMRLGTTLLMRTDGKVLMAVLLALLGVFIAGGFNPYLATIYTPYLAILYLAAKEMVSAALRQPHTGLSSGA